MRVNRSNIAITAIFILLTVVTLVLAQKSNSESMPENNGSLTEVESKYVCMVNNSLFQTEQIPVEVAGKTYYGCCEMCKAKLKDSTASRYAIDPVSGNKVDKAQSVIGATDTGKVYYFESKENLVKFTGK